VQLIDVAIEYWQRTWFSPEFAPYYPSEFPLFGVSDGPKLPMQTHGDALCGELTN